MVCSPTATAAAAAGDGHGVFVPTTPAADHLALPPPSPAPSCPVGQVLVSWLEAAVLQVPSALLAPHEGRALLLEWGPILATGSADGSSPGVGTRGASKGIGAARSYLLARRLKRLVRDFAERNNRAGRCG